MVVPCSSIEFTCGFSIPISMHWRENEREGEREKGEEKRWMNEKREQNWIVRSIYSDIVLKWRIFTSIKGEHRSNDYFPIQRYFHHWFFFCETKFNITLISLSGLFVLAEDRAFSLDVTSSVCWCVCYWLYHLAHWVSPLVQWANGDFYAISLSSITDNTRKEKENKEQQKHTHVHKERINGTSSASSSSRHVQLVLLVFSLAMLFVPHRILIAIFQQVNDEKEWQSLIVLSSPSFSPFSSSSPSSSSSFVSCIHKYTNTYTYTHTILKCNRMKRASYMVLSS